MGINGWQLPSEGAFQDRQLALFGHWLQQLPSDGDLASATVVETLGMGHGLLGIAGSLALAVSLLHAIIAFSPAWCRNFGAPERFVALGPVVVAIVTLLLAAVFGTWSLYAFSGAGWLRPLPLLAPALIGIGAVFTARGLALFPQILTRTRLVRWRIPNSRSDIISSVVSLLIGTTYLAGTIGSWQVLPR
jgi:hypothetical protein